MKTIRQKQQVLTLVGALFLVGTVCVLMLTVTSATQSFGFGVSEFQTPTVTIAPQVEAPLQINSVSVDVSDPLSPQVNFLVTNTSGKAIRAYAVVENVSTANTQSESVSLKHFTSASELLQAGDSKPNTLGSLKLTVPSENITLTIDFVEFDGGTVWGLNKTKSADRLAGQRAGAKDTKVKLNELLRTQGLDAVIATVSGNAGVVDTTEEVSGHSRQWKEGYATGKGVVFNRIRLANKRGGVKAVEVEMQKPNDLAEGGKQ